MVEMKMVYRGELRCEALHTQSGAVIQTDAPRDNMGKGEAFSPTDLIATAMGTCMLTTMAIRAHKLGVNLEGSTVVAVKEMVLSPVRRIRRIRINISIPGSFTQEQRATLEEAAMSCPVHKSIHPDVDVPVEFNWIG